MKIILIKLNKSAWSNFWNVKMLWHVLQFLIEFIKFILETFFIKIVIFQLFLLSFFYFLLKFLLCFCHLNFIIIRIRLFQFIFLDIFNLFWLINDFLLWTWAWCPFLVFSFLLKQRLIFLYQFTNLIFHNLWGFEFVCNQNALIIRIWKSGSSRWK